MYAKMACCNLGYQMRWSAEELERRLEKQGNPHVIQFKCEGSEQEYHEQRSEAAGEGHLKVPFHVWPVGETIQRASPLVVRLSGPRAKPSGSE